MGSNNTGTALNSIAIGQGIINSIANSLQIGPNDASKITVLS